MGVYLDYNASTPIDERVLTEMMDIYRNHYGNADSRTHQFGSDAKRIVERARQQLAKLLKVKEEDICFTSGSTESNNMAVLGLEAYGKTAGRRHIITTAIEHKSVLEPCRVLNERGFEIEYIYPKENGRIDADEVLALVRPDTLLVSVMHVNNETGTIQPVQEIGEALAETETYFHVDASQSCGKLVEELQELSYDLLSLSAHKMYGPQGVGALVCRRKNGRLSELRPILYGGGQEHGMRPGTLPVALIGGLGKTAELILKEYKTNQKYYKENRKAILETLQKGDIRYKINGDQDYGVDTTLNISFEGYDSEALMLAVQDRAQIGISNGSACTSYNYAPSYVLQAMGLDERTIACAVRISWGKEAVDRALLEKTVEIVREWQN